MPSAALIKDGFKGAKMLMSSVGKSTSKFIPDVERAFQSGKETEFVGDLAKKADHERTLKAMGENAKKTMGKAGELGKKGVGKAWDGTKRYTNWAVNAKHPGWAFGAGAAGVAGTVYAGHKIKQGVSNFLDPTAHADTKGGNGQQQSGQQDGNSKSNLLKDVLLMGGGLLAGSALLGKSGPLGFLMKAGMLVLALNILGHAGTSEKLVNGLDNGLKGFENTVNPLLPNSTDAQVKANEGKNPDTKANLQDDTKQASHAPSDGATQNYAAQTQNQIGKVAGQNAPQAQNQAQNNKQLQADGPETQL